MRAWLPFLRGHPSTLHLPSAGPSTDGSFHDVYLGSHCISQQNFLPSLIDADEPASSLTRISAALELGVICLEYFFAYKPLGNTYQTNDELQWVRSISRATSCPPGTNSESTSHISCDKYFIMGKWLACMLSETTLHHPFLALRSSKAVSKGTLARGRVSSPHRSRGSSHTPSPCETPHSMSTLMPHTICTAPHNHTSGCSALVLHGGRAGWRAGHFTSHTPCPDIPTGPVGLCSLSLPCSCNPRPSIPPRHAAVPSFHLHISLPTCLELRGSRAPRACLPVVPPSSVPFLLSAQIVACVLQLAASYLEHALPPHPTQHATLLPI